MVHRHCAVLQMLGMGGRTQQEQIDALLAEISDEVEIDARAADTNITDRLHRPNVSHTSSGLPATHALYKLC